MSENHFRSHFWPFLINTKFFIIFIFTKWLPAPILDVRNSLSIAFLAISDQCATLIFLCNFFYKMAAGGHFGCPKITFDLISIHFTSIHNFFLFWNFWQNGWRRPFWMSEFNFRSHFWPFQIDTKLLFVLNFLQNGCRRPFWMSEIHFGSHFWPF